MNNNSHKIDSFPVPSVLEVADSKFLGFVRRITEKVQAIQFQRTLKEEFPEAAHVSVAWALKKETGFDEDGEPANSAGPAIRNEIEKVISSAESIDGVAVVVVRYFGGKLLGVTCGRLSQCYGSTTKLALHRFFNPDKAMEQEFLNVDNSMYGIAAGDSELVLNVVSDPDKDLLNEVISELEFGGFKGSRGEVLPRQQNLQADISGGILPVYRYPGNYHGDEWETYEWSPASLKIKKAVEVALLPLVEQEMNHCVANLYSKGDDFIAHHSDKDLDLDKEGVIVSVSLGEERVMELKRRAEPKDTTRIILPHCSMLVLGPKTNKQFTHSILKKEDSKCHRLSLTLRHVTTYMDKKTGRLFGQGVSPETLDDVRKIDRIENCIFLLGAVTLAAFAFPKRAQMGSKFGGKEGVVLGGAFVAALYSFRFIRKNMVKRGEEREAREFFSRTSATGTKY